ncbi:hypothetical protein [Barnesiella intestinihominis]|uniref:hypothetical protein n=1 Tax=Barnesiella intestinihominis TaxID=487174 RepID=UPI003FEE993C
MKFNTIDDLKAAGFEGFIPVAQLQTDSTAIPRTAGVYMVVYTGGKYARVSLPRYGRIL